MKRKDGDSTLWGALKYKRNLTVREEVHARKRRGRWGGRPEVIANTAKREGIGKHGNLGIRGVTDYARNTYYSEPNAGIGA